MDIQPSLILGINKNGSYNLSDGQRNVLLVAPTGKGKGVAVVIPNLLQWSVSAIIHDIKMENFEITSGWREKQGHKIYFFAPLSANRKTHRYNPLDHISSDKDQIVSDIQRIAHLLIGGSCTVSADARNLLTSIVLHLTSNPKRTRSFGEVVRILLGDCGKELNKTNDNIHPIGKALISSFLQASDCKKSCAVSMLLTKLELWTNPFIDHATSASDFNVADFKKEKSTLYIGLEPNDIMRLAPLMQLFYQHFVQMLSNPVPDAKKEPNRVLFIMDDFPSIGKMDMFLTNLPYFRGYHICALLIAKSIEHIKNCYGDLGTDLITSDCNYKITYTAQTYSTAEHFSKISDLSAEELINLGQESQVLLVDGEKPVRSKKLRYFDDKNFDGKILKPAKI